MARHTLLNNVDHKDLRVDTRYGADLGDDLMSVPVVPDEFRNVQSCYPIVFGEDATGKVQPLALLGLEQRSNLFLEGGRWNATYIPLAIERRPFLIGRDGDELLVHVDLDDPLIVRDGGEPVFREHGGTTDYLERITSLLLVLHNGLEKTPAFVARLEQLQLLEPFALDYRLDAGPTRRLAGFHVIDEERLRRLGGQDVADLHRLGYLEPVYMALASMSRFRDLIDRANNRHAA